MKKILILCLFLFGCSPNYLVTSKENKELIDNNKIDEELKRFMDIDDFTGTKTIYTELIEIGQHEVASLCKISFRLKRSISKDGSEFLILKTRIISGGLGDLGCLTSNSTMMVKFVDGEVITLNNSSGKVDCGEWLDSFYVTLDSNQDEESKIWLRESGSFPTEQVLNSLLKKPIEKIRVNGTEYIRDYILYENKQSVLLDSYNCLYSDED